VREEELQAIFWDNAQRLMGAVMAREEGR
jgi:hypothetical protein